MSQLALPRRSVVQIGSFVQGVATRSNHDGAQPSSATRLISTVFHDSL